MDDVVLMLIFLLFGIFFIWYSQHKKSFEKTAAIQGDSAAKTKFRIMKWCGYCVLFCAGALGFLILADMLSN